jgi:hypothetical protein
MPEFCNLSCSPPVTNNRSAARGPGSWVALVSISGFWRWARSKEPGRTLGATPAALAGNGKPGRSWSGRESKPVKASCMLACFASDN